MPAVQAGSEAGLELLPLVLWSRLRADGEAAVLGRPLPGALLESRLSAASAHAVYALLPVVPPESAPEMEGARQHGDVCLLRLGSLWIVLGVLSLVREGAAQAVILRYRP